MDDSFNTSFFIQKISEYQLSVLVLLNITNFTLSALINSTCLEGIFSLTNSNLYLNNVHWNSRFFSHYSIFYRFFSLNISQERIWVDNSNVNIINSTFENIQCVTFLSCQSESRTVSVNLKNIYITNVSSISNFLIFFLQSSVNIINSIFENIECVIFLSSNQTNLQDNAQSQFINLENIHIEIVAGLTLFSFNFTDSSDYYQLSFTNLTVVGNNISYVLFVHQVVIDLVLDSCQFYDNYGLDMTLYVEGLSSSQISFLHSSVFINNHAGKLFLFNIFIKFILDKNLIYIANFSLSQKISQIYFDCFTFANNTSG